MLKLSITNLLFFWFLVLIVKGPIQSTQLCAMALIQDFAGSNLPYFPLVFHPACTRVLQIVMVPIHCILLKTGRYVDFVLLHLHCWWFYFWISYCYSLLFFIILRISVFCFFFLSFSNFWSSFCSWTILYNYKKELLSSVNVWRFCLCQHWIHS